jgi:hypothetical protein
MFLGYGDENELVIKGYPDACFFNYFESKEKE